MIKITFGKSKVLTFLDDKDVIILRLDRIDGVKYCGLRFKIYSSGQEFVFTHTENKKAYNELQKHF